MISRIKSKDHLLIKAGGLLLDATLEITTVPRDEVGPAHQKYTYSLSNGHRASYGYSRSEALSELIKCADEAGWVVLQPLN